MVQGAGLGFRRELREELLCGTSLTPSFVEFAPENWMETGGYWGRILNQLVERYPILSHGLSLSLGSPEPLDESFIDQIKRFLKQTKAQIYSEHLSYSKCNNAHLYDLLPIPFREEAIVHVAQRIRHVQERLERRIAIENVSYYAMVAPEMDEATFIRSVVEEADCDLLLDINNVYVNAFNHGYDARIFLSKLPLERVVYVHMAGHEDVDEGLKVDTHGTPICEGVFELFSWIMPQLKEVPVLLERDHQIPPAQQLQGELNRLNQIVQEAKSAHAA